MTYGLSSSSSLVLPSVSCISEGPKTFLTHISGLRRERVYENKLHLLKSNADGSRYHSRIGCLISHIVGLRSVRTCAKFAAESDCCRLDTGKVGSCGLRLHSHRDPSRRLFGCTSPLTGPFRQ